MFRHLIIKATHICNAFERRHYPILWLLSVLLPPALLVMLWSFNVHILMGFDCLYIPDELPRLHGEIATPSRTNCHAFTEGATLPI